MRKRTAVFVLVLLVAVAGAVVFVRVSPKLLSGASSRHTRAPDRTTVWDWEDWDKAEGLITVANEEGLPQLHRSAGEGDVAEVRRLLRQGADVNARDRDGWTPLHWAAFEGHAEVVGLLLSEGASPEAKAYDMSGSGVRFRSDLLPRGSPAQWRSAHKREKETPLKAALARGHKEAGEVLLDSPSTPVNKDKLLFWAAEKGYEAGAEILLRRGATVDARDEHGWTPLHWAAEQGDERMALLLLENDADANARSTKEKRFFAVPAAILRKPTGSAPLHLASEESIAKLLLARGAAVNASDSEGNTALHLAANGGDLARATALFEGKADPNARNNRGDTPLHKAVAFIEPKMTSLLLQRRADPNLPDNEGRSPLHRAAEWGNVHQVSLLLSEGADATLRDKRGLTPLELALQADHQAVVALLRPR